MRDDQTPRRLLASGFCLDGRVWKQTNLGKKFYANATDRYVVSFPVSVDIVRKNGTVYRMEDWLASTATPLGGIRIKRGASEHEELAEVKRKTREFLDTLSVVEGEKIILGEYETHILDTQREMIKLLDGTSRAVSVWSAGGWRQTDLGKKFYVNATDRYVVSSPVSVDIVRKNGTVYRREDWLASTAVPLGEIEIKRGASEHDELVEVKRRTREFLDGLRRSTAKRSSSQDTKRTS